MLIPGNVIYGSAEVFIGKETINKSAATISHSCGKSEIGFLSPTINKTPWKATTWGLILQDLTVLGRRA